MQDDDGEAVNNRITNGLDVNLRYDNGATLLHYATTRVQVNNTADYEFGVKWEMEF